MQSQVSEDESKWQELTPFLDEALEKLNEDERGVLLLRFFDHKPFAQVGAAYRISEDAAKMRVTRALEKLRDLLADQKVYCTTALLGGLLLQRAVEAAPAGVAGKMALVQPAAIHRGAFLRPSPRMMVVGTACLVLVVGTLLVAQQGRRPWNPGTWNPLQRRLRLY